MSEENVEVVRSVYEAWAQHEYPGPAHVLDAQIQYVNPPGAVEPGTRHGLAAFTRAIEKVFEGWESWQMEPERFRPSADQVAVVVRYRARGRGSGVEMEGRESALWTVRDGKVVRYEWCHELADALEAAGPSEWAMPQHPVDTLRLFYEAASRDDLDALSELVARDVELIPPNRSPDSAPVKGMQEVRAWWADQGETVGNLSIEVEKLIEAEEFIVALIRLRIRPHGADADFELRIAHLWTLRDGKLIRCEIFPDRAEALEAAGSPWRFD